MKEKGELEQYLVDWWDRYQDLISTLKSDASNVLQDMYKGISLEWSKEIEFNDFMSSSLYTESKEEWLIWVYEETRWHPLKK